MTAGAGQEPERLAQHGPTLGDNLAVSVAHTPLDGDDPPPGPVVGLVRVTVRSSVQNLLGEDADETANPRQERDTWG